MVFAGDTVLGFYFRWTEDTQPVAKNIQCEHAQTGKESRCFGACSFLGVNLMS
jgi:hypothetical protein